jgi:hypothetical protein
MKAIGVTSKPKCFSASAAKARTQKSVLLMVTRSHGALPHPDLSGLSVREALQFVNRWASLG